jgi:hypothetical protein
MTLSQVPAASGRPVLGPGPCAASRTCANTMGMGSPPEDHRMLEKFKKESMG